tara:strand:- start:1666 stop:2700 length:1035 start_codon:yes stop_codon:yes gene_type:complete
MVERIKIIGVANSPYTRKMLSILRYKHIPYEVHWGDVGTHLSQLGIEPPRPILLPTVLLKNKENVYEAVTDTTPIIRRLENDYPARNTIPEDPALSFINYLLEDFGDEWVTKYMFHYRWHFEEDADNAGTILPLSHAVNLPEDIHSDFKSIVAKRQIDRLWVVGSSDKTAALIDSSYKRFLKLMEDHLSICPFLFGNKPSSADFSIFGQLTQLVGFDPTSRKIAHEISSRTVAWVDIMEDLSGINPNESDWTTLENSPETLKEILKEVGKVYVPALLQNDEAVKQNADTWEAEINGSTWKQKTFNYQAKCLSWIRDEFQKLNDADKSRVIKYIDGTGCENLLKI